MYQELHKTSFQFDHCWNMLRCNPKWLEHYERDKMKRTRSAITSSPSTPELINLGEDEVSYEAFVNLERPLDRKVEKERLRKRKSEDNTSSNRILNEIKEEKKINDEEIEILEKACFQEHEKEQEQDRRKQEQEQKRIRIKKEQEQEQEQERLRIMQEKLRMEQLKEEERIIMMDTSSLSQMQQEYYHQRQIEILESRRSK